MNGPRELAAGMIAKGESDLAAARTLIEAGVSLDSACFHAQQAAEKFLKAYLARFEIEFPFIHNLEKLITLCESRDRAFSEIKEIGQELSPFAVEMRYDDMFWPSQTNAKRALKMAETICEFVRARLT
ncbi:HEPN domain-containing protein [candidate division KSB1 bacterium]|nr:HEPN domain-containing protein [candidate division KSB1 bacterium]